MKSSWLIHEKRKTVLLFFAGWGMDERPFKVISSKKYDVLICFDYTDGMLDPRIFSLLKEYDDVIFLGWSMGVFHGIIHAFQFENNFAKSIALNGTVSFVDDDFGIPESVFCATLENLTEASLVKFYKRMCADSDILRRFLENRPLRRISELKEELECIYARRNTVITPEVFYTDVIISQNDRIFPFAHQHSSWHGSAITSIATGHFPFYNFETWEDLIEVSEREGNNRFTC